MANGTKVYNIKINGLQESVSAADALISKLNDLEKRLNALGSKGISVGGGTSASKELNAQASLLDKIAREELKVEEARDKNYQYLVKIKDELKQVTTAQKAAAAASKLDDNAYNLDTMEGMKAKLKDIKAVMQTTPTGSTLFSELSNQAEQLTSDLKKIEEEYGTFGRNVGNYKSAFEGLTEITVKVGDVERSFKNAKQASNQLKNELKALGNQGKVNTKEYRDLAEAIDELERKTGGMSQTMDGLLNAMQSMTALASISGGFSAFFGVKDNDIQQSIQRLVALQNVLQGIEVLRKQMQTNKGIGAILAEGNSAVDRFVASLTNAKIETEGLTMASRGATIAVRTLSTALKAVGVGIAIAGITALVSLFSKAGKYMADGADAASLFNARMEKLNKTYSERNDLLKAQYVNGEIDRETFLNGTISNQNDYLKENIKLLKERSSLGGWAKSIGELWGGKGVDVENGGERTVTKIQMFPKGGGIFGISRETINSIDEAKKKFNELNKEINDGVGFWDNLFGTTKRNQVTVGNQILSDFIKRVGEVDFNSENAKKDVEALYNEMNRDDALQSILLNLDKFIPDEESVRAIQNITNALIDSYDRLSTESAKFKNAKGQWEIDAMPSGYAKSKAELDRQQAEEEAQWSGNSSAMEAIAKKYAQRRAELWKGEKKAILDSDDELMRLRIEKMREGYAKTLAELELEKKQRIRQAEESERDVQAKIQAIEELFEEKRLQAYKDFREQIVDVEKDFKKSIEEINNEIANLRFDTSSMSEDDAFEKRLEAYKQQLIEIENISSSLNSKISANYFSKKTNEMFGLTPEDINTIIPEQFETVLDLTENFYSDQFNIEKEHYEKHLDLEKSRLSFDLENRKKEYDDEYEAMREELLKQRQYEVDSLVADDNYEQNKEAILQKYNALELSAEQAHNDRKIALEENYKQQITTLVNETNANIQESNASRFDQEIRSYERYFQTLQSVQSQQPTKDRSGWGIVDIKTTRDNFKAALDGYKELSNRLQEEKKKLKTAMDKGEITFVEFTQANAQIEQLESNIAKSADEINKNLKNVIGEFIASINTYIQALGNGLQNILSQVYANQDAAFEKEKETLQKHLEEYEEALKNQQDLTKKYSDNINSIEDELSEARGDRRQQLIDMLNQQKAAQRASLNEEKKIEKEKEAMEARQEQLEQEQKRREHKRAITDAIISAALAVVNGLATKPFVPVGIAMGSLAAALGAVQVALIKSQKYANGGLLEGKSHSQGGIKTTIGNRPIELEGNEYVIRKSSTKENLNLLDFINRSEKKLSLSDFIDFYGSGRAKESIKKNMPKTRFADGGVIPSLRTDISLNNRFINALEQYADRPSVVSVVEIMDKENEVKNVRAIAGLDD